MKCRPMKKIGKTYNYCTVEEATHIEFFTPGPYHFRLIPVILKGTRAGTGCWSWNGSLDKPTLKPSIIVKGTVPLTDEEADRVLAGEKIEPKPQICHTWITDGQVQFLSDCTHELAGKIIDLLEVEDQ